MTRHDDSNEPPRLAERADAAGALLRGAERAYHRGVDEPARWARLRGAPAPLPVPGGWGARLVRLAFPLAAAGALTAVVVSKRRAAPELPAARPAPGEARIAFAPSVVPLPARSPAAPAAGPDPAAAPRPLVPGRRPRPLPAGATVLADGTRIEVAPRAVATVSASAHADRAVTTVALAVGVLDLDVAPRDGRPPIQVEGGHYRFQVLGARFRVARTEARAEVEVRDGMVAVVAGERVIARVKSGQRWTGPLLASSGARATSEAAGAVPAASDDAAARPRETAGPDCLALARGGLARRAVDCFARIAEGTGLSAEMALYEMARLRRDVLGDAAGAAAALEQYRRQFPRGSLRTEVDVSLLELLPRLGRAGEALADSERLLATAAGRERALELRLLRGNIYRELLRDFGRAEVEYAPAAADRGATGDEASFQRAVCLQALGRVAEARAAFRRYAERPNPRHAAEAARLRGVLDGRE